MDNVGTEMDYEAMAREAREEAESSMKMLAYAMIWSAAVIAGIVWYFL